MIQWRVKRFLLSMLTFDIKGNWEASETGVTPFCCSKIPNKVKFKTKMPNSTILVANINPIKRTFMLNFFWARYVFRIGLLELWKNTKTLISRIPCISIDVDCLELEMSRHNILHIERLWHYEIIRQPLWILRLAQGRVKHHICKMQLQNGIQMSAGFL